MHRPTVVSLFSGCGGTDLGLSQAGCEVVESVEYDPEACATLRANFTHRVCEKDIRQELVKDRLDADVYSLTFPCTKYSTIADIHGTRTGDDLFLHAFRNVVLAKPEAFFCENVVGMRRFKVVMEAFTKLPDYYTQVFCPLDASTWLPQKRARLILIATRKPFPIQAPAPNIRRPKLADLLDREPQVEIPDYVLARLNGKYRDRPIISDPENPHELAPTCVAHYHKDVSTRMVRDRNHALKIRPYSPREYSRLQGFPDTFKFPVSDRQIYKQVGNAVPVDMARWIGQQLVAYFNRDTRS